MQGVLGFWGGSVGKIMSGSRKIVPEKGGSAKEPAAKSRMRIRKRLRCVVLGINLWEPWLGKIIPGPTQ